MGAFAVEPNELAAGTESALFRLFVALTMYQALRDVVIARQQRSLPRASMRIVADLAFVKRAVTRHPCAALRSVGSFEEDCDVSKAGEEVDCGRCPGAACHVKDATVVFNRMGDMGKLPTSACLRVWKGGGVGALLKRVCKLERSPTKRAALLVDHFACVHRVGRKLATMFVSALSTPVLAPGLTPWFPAVDGNELVVVDTNVARAVDALREPGATRTYDARERWVASSQFRASLPPRPQDQISTSMSIQNADFFSSLLANPHNAFARVDINFLSDSVVVAVRPKLREDLIVPGPPNVEIPRVDQEILDAMAVMQVAHITSRVLRLATEESPAIAYRGSVSFGEFDISDNFLVGPAVDQAASIMELAQGAFVWADPKAKALIDTSTLRPGFPKFPWVPYSIPLKGGDTFQSYAVCPEMDGSNLRDQNIVIGNLLASFDSPSIDVQIKREKTLFFLGACQDAAIAYERGPK